MAEARPSHRIPSFIRFYDGRKKAHQQSDRGFDCTFCNAVAADPPDIPFYTTEPLTEPQRLGYVHPPGLTRGVYGSI